MIFIICWLVIILVFSIVVGEIIYRKSKNNIINNGNVSIHEDAESCSDISLKNLSIEELDFVSSVDLAARGSWRLAQNNVMSYETFKALRDEEYAKRLK